MGIRKTIVYRDRGLEAILKQVTAGQNIAGRVGVLDPTASAPHPLRQNITIGEVAIINEFGSKNAGVPRRSYLKSSFDDARMTGRFMKLMGTALQQVINGTKGPRAALLEVGAEMQRAVVFKIGLGVDPPNHPRTIKEKGHDRTLQHTGTLVNAISHDVQHHIAYGDSATTFVEDVAPREYEATTVAGGEGPYESVSVEGGE